MLTRKLLLAACLAVPTALFAAAAESSATPAPSAAPHFDVKVVDGIVQPARPMNEAIADAIQFLRRADAGYVPGNIDGPLAGYFMRAHVLADGSQPNRRQLSYPARHHAYFILTFLHYYAYTGNQEWLQRARDLADWNLRNSTPATCAYPNLPYSAWQDNKPTGSADKNSIETDKPAFVGDAYLSLYETTGDARYLEGARKIAATLVPKQRADGSWPFRVIPEDGTVYEDFGGAPVFFIQFFEHLLRHENKPEYARARDAATRLMIARNVEEGKWGTYHEDIKPKEATHLSAEPMSFTAIYLLSHAGEHPEYVGMGRKILAQMEAKLVFTDNHPISPAPGVAEQATFAHIMAGHTARYCLALAQLYRDTGDDAVRKRALSGLNGVTFMQSPLGMFRTHVYDTKRKMEKDPATAPNWYSQHLYAVCHILESMPILPELAPDGEDHILGSTTSLREVQYQRGAVGYAATLPTETTVKVSFAPASVQLGGKPLPKLAKRPSGAESSGWHFDSATHTVHVSHPAGSVRIQQ